MALILCVPDDSDSEEEGSVASWDERFSEDTGSESGGSIVPMFIMSPPQSVAGSEMVTFEEFWGGPRQAQNNVEVSSFCQSFCQLTHDVQLTTRERRKITSPSNVSPTT